MAFGFCVTVRKFFSTLKLPGNSSSFSVGPCLVSFFAFQWWASPSGVHTGVPYSFLALFFFASSYLILKKENNETQVHLRSQLAYFFFFFFKDEEARGPKERSEVKDWTWVQVPVHSLVVFFSAKVSSVPVKSVWAETPLVPSYLVWIRGLLKCASVLGRATQCDLNPWRRRMWRSRPDVSVAPRECQGFKLGSATARGHSRVLQTSPGSPLCGPTLLSVS